MSNRKNGKKSGGHARHREGAAKKRNEARCVGEAKILKGDKLDGTGWQN